MPWLRSRTERASGITTWSIEWREGGRGGRVRARTRGAVTEKEAEFELAALQAGTYHRSRRGEYGGLRVDEARRMKDMPRENGRLKKIVADQQLDIPTLKEVASANPCPHAT